MYNYTISYKESILTLALKYRPKRFEELIGQEAISQTLQRALQTKQLSHAYLFSGLRGSGKTSTARIFSKALLCEKGPTSTPCEECQNCIAANEHRHIDIIEMDAASNRKIDDIRELIEHTKYKPALGRYKIFIIDEVHMLTKEAFNALLKTLEEPPEYVKFILATTDPLKLPATILSRTQHFRFKKIAQSDIIHHLEHILHLENVEFEPKALEIIARSGEGSLRDTLTLLEQAITYAKGTITTQSVTNMLGLVDPKVIEELFKAILDQDKNRVLELIKNIKEYQTQMILDEMIIYLKTNLFSGSKKLSLMLYERFFKILSESKSMLFFSSDDEFILLLTALKLLEATKLKEIEELIEELESKKLSKPLQPSLIAPPPPTPKSQNNLFELLIQKLYDRSYELGECFSKSVRFVSFENQILKWQSEPLGECKERLKHAYPIIKHFVQEIFGIDTKIQKVDTPKKCDEPSSMIEEAEFGTSSCIQSHFQAIESEDILKAPMVQKAKELFKPKRIIVKTKV